MRGQALCPSVSDRRPPRQAPLGKTLVAEPKSLTVIHEQLQGRRPPIAEDEDGAGERVVLEGLLAEPGQAVDAATEIGRLDGHQDFHVGRDLKHQGALQKPRASASMSAASWPTSCTRMVAPAPLSSST